MVISVANWSIGNRSRVWLARNRSFRHSRLYKNGSFRNESIGRQAKSCHIADNWQSGYVLVQYLTFVRFSFSVWRSFCVCLIHISGRDDCVQQHTGIRDSAGRSELAIMSARWHFLRLRCHELSTLLLSCLCQCLSVPWNIEICISLWACNWHLVNAHSVHSDSFFIASCCSSTYDIHFFQQCNSTKWLLHIYQSTPLCILNVRLYCSMQIPIIFLRWKKLRA